MGDILKTSRVTYLNAEKIYKVQDHLECWSTALHAVVLTLMREHYYCVYLHMPKQLSISGL